MSDFVRYKISAISVELKDWLETKAVGGWNCKSDSDRLCLRISTAKSGINQEIRRQQRNR